MPTPLAVGIGAGVWYEWQTLEKVGSDLAWKYSPPKWKLEGSGGKVLLRMRNIPEQNGARVNFRIRTDDWGADDTILFARSAGRKGEFNLTGTVHEGMLWDGRAAASKGKGKDGFNLSAYTPTGKSVIGLLSTSKNKKVVKSSSMKVGVSICRGRINLYKWESKKYVKVLTDSSGKFLSTSEKGWKD